MTSNEILSLIKSLEIGGSDSSTSAQNLDNNIIHEPLEIARVYLCKRLEEQLRLLETISKRKLDADRARIQY